MEDKKVDLKVDGLPFFMLCYTLYLFFLSSLPQSTHFFGAIVFLFNKESYVYHVQF